MNAPQRRRQFTDDLPACFSRERQIYLYPTLGPLPRRRLPFCPSFDDRFSSSRFNCPASPVWSVAFSPYGRHLASASDDCTVRIRDAVMLVPLQELDGHTGWAWSVAFSPDGRRLASPSSDQTACASGTT
jgi:WD40 repeat protein